MIKSKKTSFFNILRQDGPWGNYDANKKPNNPNKAPSDPMQDLDQFLKKAMSFVDSFFQKKGDKSNNGNSGCKKPIIFIILIAIVFWLSLGFYKVKTGENAVVMYFGKFHSVSFPGLNYRFPAPIGKVIKKDVEKINQDSFGMENLDESSDRWSHARSLKSKSLYRNNTRSSTTSMLTGDENIVDVNFTVRWKIGDIKNFVFNVYDPRFAVIKAAESAMREVIATKPISDALSDGKQAIEEESRELLQKVLTFYKAGVFIEAVQLGKVEPPAEVIESFRDVQAAKADKENKINEAKSYSNNVIPVSRGDSARIVNQAKAYEKEVIANAQGEAKRFNSIYREYRVSKYITKQRMKIEAMEKIYEAMDKIIIDPEASASGVVPYLPLNQLKK